MEGEWVSVSRNTWGHGEVAGNAHGVLRDFCRANPGWRLAGGDPGSRLQDDPATLRVLDVALHREDGRSPGRGAQGWLDGAPDLAVEVAGDNQSTVELLEKRLEYIRGGVVRVWAVELDPERVILLTPPNQLRSFGPEDTLEGGDVLPGFSCPVVALFE